MRQMCAAALVGDVKQARELNLKLLPLHQRLFVEANPIPVKWALAEMGMIEHGLRLPLVPLSEKFHQTVREALHEAGIALPGLRVIERRG
jgi:4-hydroxy-tetrahydrodipicolinate synthase